MGRLVYHDQLTQSGQISPFDEAVLEVARSSSVGIVSPYIGVDYLQRIIHVSNGWRLISDVEAWLSSLSIHARPKAWLFIRTNLVNIHHYPAIHAKAMISQKSAMFGSANLTNAGILNRTEMGILIDEPKIVAELGAWFDSLWEQTLPPVADETNAFVQWLDEGSRGLPTRRNKLSLSTTTKKIRARLVKLEMPLKSESKSTHLSLDPIAKALVLEEQRHYDSIEAAIEEVIETLVKEAFCFGQVVTSVHRIFPTASIREIFFALIQHCANHVRSVFSENTRNRLILCDGKFTQSTGKLIPYALSPFDSFLALVVYHFDFSQAHDLPNENIIEKQTSIRAGHQVILISELLNCGFLELEDLAGHLPQYRLSEDFEWGGRYKLFTKSMHDWVAKKNRPKRQAEISISRTAGNQYYAGTEFTLTNAADNLFEENDVPSQWERNVVPDVSTINAEATRLKKERLEKIDKVLSRILLRLFGGERLVVSKKLAEEIAAETSVGSRLVWLIISGKARDIPMVIMKRDNAISICPGLDWRALTSLPGTENICKNFLDAS